MRFKQRCSVQGPTQYQCLAPPLEDAEELKQGAKVAKYEGEIEAGRMTKPLHQSHCTARRSTWQGKWWTSKDLEYPARPCLEKRIKEKQQGARHAESFPKGVQVETPRIGMFLTS